MGPFDRQPYAPSWHARRAARRDLLHAALGIVATAGALICIGVAASVYMVDFMSGIIE